MNTTNVKEFDRLGRFPKVLSTYICTHLAPVIGRDTGVKALDLAGITHLGDLTARSEKDLQRIKGIGPERLRAIKAWVQAQGCELDHPNAEWLKFANRCRARARSSEHRWISQVLRPTH